MDAVSVLRAETCWKLGEVETYLLDFQDIIENIEASERADAQAQAAAQAEARRTAKLRAVRESHAAYERERLERGEHETTRHQEARRKAIANAVAGTTTGAGGGGGVAHAHGGDAASYSQSSSQLEHSSRDYSQSSSVAYRS